MKMKEDNMRKILFLCVILLLPIYADAESVILMIGDGMGTNHLKCANITKPLYILTLPMKGSVHTYSADSKITDSAASATAYSCGKKTNNRYLGKLPNKENCLTIAEEAIQKGLSVGIYSTDHPTGVTPSAFYAHTLNRENRKKIEKQKQIAAQQMDIAVPIPKISNEILTRLKKLSSKPNKKSFFAMFEGAKIDTNSHAGKLRDMKEELYDFDLAVMKATQFVYNNPETTLIVLADHETGGLTDECKYATGEHTSVDIPVYAYGKHAELFLGVQDNTEIYHKMYQILFQD